MENNNEEVEKFRDIPGYEGLYQVSDMGRVKSLAKEVIRSNGSKLIYKDTILNPALNSNGYKICRLSKSKKYTSIEVHQLVARAFLGHVPDGYTIVVDHINNIKTQNNIKNLQLISHRENCSKDKKGGTSEYIGVDFVKKHKKWRVRIYIKGVKIDLGKFNSENEAGLVYQTSLVNSNLFQGDNKKFIKEIHNMLGIFKKPYEVKDLNTGIVYKSLKDMSIITKIPYVTLKTSMQSKKIKKYKLYHINIKYIKNLNDK